MLTSSSFTRNRGNNRRLTPRLFPLAIAIAISLVGISSTASASNLAAQSSRYYPNTGFAVGGAFLQFFDAHGGVRVFGYPITNETAEGGRTVQYFERQRFEYHQESAGTEYQVQLGALGAASAQGKVSLAPVSARPSTSATAYFHETGHTLSDGFLNFWRANGGLRILGYPVSEPVNINGYVTQYFERARMEYHPEKVASGYSVELGQLGREYVAAHPGIATGAGAGIVASTNSSLSPRSQQLLDLINGARLRVGARPVAASDQVSKIAQQRSSDMAARGYFAHVTPEGKSFEDFLKSAAIRFKFGGEILSKNNFREDLAVGKSFEWFMSSPEHHSILIDPRYTVAGVGEAKDSQGYYVFTVIFVQTP